jgi:hypothetical protein
MRMSSRSTRISSASGSRTRKKLRRENVSLQATRVVVAVVVEEEEVVVVVSRLS